MTEQSRKTTLETALTSRTPAPGFCPSTLYPVKVPHHALLAVASRQCENFLRAIMHIMSSPSSVRQISFVLSCTSCPRRPQYGKFPSCYHAHHILAVLSTASSFAQFLRTHRFLRSIIKRRFSNGVVHIRWQEVASPSLFAFAPTYFLSAIIAFRMNQYLAIILLA